MVAEERRDGMACCDPTTLLMTDSMISSSNGLATSDSLSDPRFSLLWSPCLFEEAWALCTLLLSSKSRLLPLRSKVTERPVPDVVRERFVARIGEEDEFREGDADGDGEALGSDSGVPKRPPLPAFLAFHCFQALRPAASNNTIYCNYTPPIKQNSNLSITKLQCP